MNIGNHMLGRVRQARHVFRAMQIKSPTYLRLLHEDLARLRDEMLRTAIGLSVAAAAGLLFIGFLSLAILVSVWETRARIPVAWGLTAGWAGISLIGLNYARRALLIGIPFPNLIPLLQRDLAAIEKEPA